MFQRLISTSIKGTVFPLPRVSVSFCRLLWIFLLVANVELRGADEPSPRLAEFQQQIRPLMEEFCFDCHNAEDMESGIRLDGLNGKLEGRTPFLWKEIRKQIASGAMPPEDASQPTAKQRERFVGWIDASLVDAQRRPVPKNGSIRRLTVAQYRNTLRDLLGLEDDFSDLLPPDAVSKDGFLNNAANMELSPLLVEAYFNIAEKALEQCIVDPATRPTIQSFRLDLGRAINPTPCPDDLILGAGSRLLKNDDFIVTQLEPTKPFEYRPFRMRTKYRFLEGYQGNATVRGWRDYDSIYHAVFACMRGTHGYPLGLADQTIPAGLLLRPASPVSELFGQSSTLGPRANFKISLRELPDYGRFRVTVNAARYDDALLLDKRADLVPAGPSKPMVVNLATSAEGNFDVPQDSVYQLDIISVPKAKTQQLSLTLGDSHFAGQLYDRRRPLLTPQETGDESDANRTVDEVQTPFMLVRLPAGRVRLTARHGDNKQLRQAVLTRLKEDSDSAVRFAKFEARRPSVGVYLGLRRDCGSTLARVGGRQSVGDLGFQNMAFEGAIRNFSSPDVEQDNVNYLAGVREIGVRHEYTDGREMARLLIKSVEFEGPMYESWPPDTHQRIFIESPLAATDRAAYALEVIRKFATRAFRRPIYDVEATFFQNLWSESYAETGDFQASIKDALLVVLTSPQFLFLIEDSSTPAGETLDAYELAAKLSYFLWNTAPDARLLELAKRDQLHASLDREVQRLIYDDRFEQFAEQFTSQWLGLDKLAVVETDRKQFGKLTRDTKVELRKEPVAFLRHLIRENLPILNLVQSDFLLANEVVAHYYGLGDLSESGFEFLPIKHADPQLGGLLSQAGILAGLSDGRESNPIKRGAWLARKIIAEPPADPPPNVPELPEGDPEANLTLRERLEHHRNQPGCSKCHTGIDPWGLPLEEFDAGGRFKMDEIVDAASTLPDKTDIANAQELKAYLATERIDQVAFSFMKHVATYATGRSLAYNEIEFLKAGGLELAADGYRIQDMIQFVVGSRLFLEK